MPRYKDYSYDQHKLLPIAFREQILPGTFEYTLNYLIDHEVDLSVFEARYRNDETGHRPGYARPIVKTLTCLPGVIHAPRHPECRQRPMRGPAGSAFRVYHDLDHGRFALCRYTR